MFANNIIAKSKSTIYKTASKGFTLIEIVIGVVVLSIALMVMTGALFPQAERSVNPWLQVRSAELAQSIMNEILARRFDENSAQIGSLRCDESGADACTSINTCDIAGYPWLEEGDETTTKDVFDDVDDFHCYEATGDEITNIENGALTDVYSLFTVEVSVQYAGSDLTLNNGLAKLVTVTVTDPRGDTTVYASYKANY